MAILVQAGMIAGEEGPPGRCRARCIHQVRCHESEDHTGTHWYKECPKCSWILFEDSTILTQAQQELRQLAAAQGHELTRGLKDLSQLGTILQRWLVWLLALGPRFEGVLVLKGDDPMFGDLLFSLREWFGHCDDGKPSPSQEVWRLQAGGVGNKQAIYWAPLTAQGEPRELLAYVIKEGRVLQLVSDEGAIVRSKAAPALVQPHTVYHAKDAVGPWLEVVLELTGDLSVPRTPDDNSVKPPRLRFRTTGSGEGAE